MSDVIYLKHIILYINYVSIKIIKFRKTSKKKKKKTNFLKMFLGSRRVKLNGIY